MVRRWPYIGGGGISQTRGAINGRIEYEHSFRQLLAKFAGGVLTLSSGLSMGREGPSVQMGSYIGDLVGKWGHILSGERKQLISAGAGAGPAAAFTAPLAAATLVIESIERFDAPKTAITTILAGVVAGAIASTIFPINPYHDIPPTGIHQASGPHGYGLCHLLDDHRPDRRRRTIPDAAGGRDFIFLYFCPDNKRHIPP